MGRPRGRKEARRFRLRVIQGPGTAQTDGEAPFCAARSLGEGHIQEDPMKVHLAEFNIGILRYDWDDPRIADFASALDHVNSIAARSPGFVWRMPDDEMDAAQRDPDGLLGGNPRTASTLSVWENVDSLENFVWRTLHKRFFDRREEWFASDQGIRLVLWHIRQGHRPTINEAVERLRTLEEHGDTEFAFSWPYARRLEGKTAI